jgi:transposase InsO family protein
MLVTWRNMMDATRPDAVGIGLLETEVIRRLGPWRSLEAVEFATLLWIDGFNHRRLFEPIGFVPPAETEADFYEAPENAPMAA